MRIRLLVSLQGPDTSLEHGDVIRSPDDLSERECANLLAAGFAEEVPEQSPGISAAPHMRAEWLPVFAQHGIATPADIAALDAADLDELPISGLGPSRAAKIIEWARQQ